MSEIKLNNIGKRIKEIRKMLHLKQGELAFELGITQSYLSEIESGSKDNIRNGLLLTLSEKYGINLHWLLTGEGVVYLEELKKLYEEKREFEKKIKDISFDSNDNMKKIEDIIWENDIDKDLAIISLRAKVEYLKRRLYSLENDKSELQNDKET